MSESKAVAIRKPVEVVCETISGMKDKFKAALPPQIDPDKFARVSIMAVQNNPSLLGENVSRASLYNACLMAAQDGLLPDGKEAAFVVFQGQVKYMPMVGGILKKVRNSGELSSITSQVVFKNDEFKYWIDGDGEHIEHRPLMFGERGAAIGVYALAKTKDGAVYIEVMDMAQIEAIRKVSKAKDSGPWAGDFKHEMWRKSAIRRLSKRLPMSTDLEQVIERDDDMYELDPQKEAGASNGSPTRLKSIITPSKETVTVDIKADDVPSESEVVIDEAQTAGLPI